MRKLQNRERVFGFIFQFSLIVLFFYLYSPLFREKFLYHDDFQVLASRPGDCSSIPQAHYYAMMGRRGALAVLCFFRAMTTTVASAWLPRFLVVASTAIFGILLVDFLKNLRIRKMDAQLLSFGICLLPGFIATAFWLSISYVIYSLLLSLIAVLLILKSETVSTPLRWPAVMIGGICMIASAITYQATVMLYFSLITLLFFYSETDENPFYPLRRYMKHIVFGFVPLLLYAIWYLYLTDLHDKLAVAEPLRGNFAVNPFARLMWFVNEPFWKSLRLWYMDSGYIVPTIVGLLIVSTLVISFFKKSGKSGLPKIFLLFLLLVTGFVVSYLPNLVSTLGAAFWRGLGPMSILGMILAYRGLEMITLRFATARTVTLLVALVVFSGYLISFRAVRDQLAYPAAAEFDFILSEVQGLRNRSDMRDLIIVIPTVRPDSTKSDDEFAIPTMAFSQDVGFMLHKAFLETGMNPSISSVVVSTELPKAENISPSDVVIDSGKLLDRGYWPDFQRK